MQYEVAIRDQDAYGEIFYNDYTGYGIQEVMENEVSSEDVVVTVLC